MSKWAKINLAYTMNIIHSDVWQINSALVSYSGLNSHKVMGYPLYRRNSTPTLFHWSENLYQFTMWKGCDTKSTQTKNYEFQFF